MDADRFEVLVQHSYDAIVLTDASNAIVYATPAVRQMFGFEPEALIGRNGFSFVHRTDRGGAVERARGLLARPDGTTRAEMRVRHADGSYRWCECTSVNLLDHAGVGAVVNSFRDITDRKAAEELAARAESRLQALLEHADGVILLADRDGYVTWASPGAERLWGWSADTLLSRQMIAAVHPDDQREIIRQYRKMASAQRLTVRVDGRMRHGDGTWRWYESVFTNCLDDPAVGGVIANVRDITDRVLADQALRNSEAQLEHQATHDALTRLPNRTLLHDRLDTALARARRTGTTVAVVLVGVDHFQVVNEGRGHAFGDATLRAVAERLATHARSGDTLARFGGDQFVIVADDLRDEREAMDLADAVVRAFDHPLSVRTEADPDPAELFLAVSVGVAVDRGHDAEPGELLRDADGALATAKSRGGGRSVQFVAGAREMARERLHLETELRRAILRHQFQVHYQPVVDLRTGAVASVEALVRWQHPQRGMLLPGSFIDVAEETGLIIPLGAWVFDASCRQLVELHDVLGGQRAPLSVGINLSARQLAEDGLIDDIGNVLAATPIHPGHVCVEVTESAVMRDPSATADRLAELRVFGLRVAIDDFGTGQASFSYLRDLPVDVLKIDQSFVQPMEQDPQAADLVAGIVGLGHTLGLEVVAEGVETDGQLQLLRDLGCDRAQGFLFSTAVAPRAVVDLLRSRPTW